MREKERDEDFFLVSKNMRKLHKWDRRTKDRTMNTRQYICISEQSQKLDNSRRKFIVGWSRRRCWRSLTRQRTLLRKRIHRLFELLLEICLIVNQRLKNSNAITIGTLKRCTTVTIDCKWVSTILETGMNERMTVTINLVKLTQRSS